MVRPILSPPSWDGEVGHRVVASALSNCDPLAWGNMEKITRETFPRFLRVFPRFAVSPPTFSGRTLKLRWAMSLPLKCVHPRDLVIRAPRHVGHASAGLGSGSNRFRAVNVPLLSLLLSYRNLFSLMHKGGGAGAAEL